MCLGIPGQVVGFVEGSQTLAMAEVAGVQRQVNLGVLGEDEPVAEGDWVLIHMGFAMEVMTADEADTAMEGLKMMGSDGGDAPDAASAPVPASWSAGD